MTKKFSFSLKWWNGEYEEKKVFKYEQANGKKILTDKYSVIKARVTLPIEDIKISPRNEVMIKLVGEKEFFKMEYGEVMLSQYTIDAVNSAFINQWNITLPLISYKKDDEDTQEDEI